MPATSPRLSLLLVIAGAVAISFSSIFARLADVPPTVSAFYRMAFGAATLGAMLALSRRWRTGWGRNWAGSALIALFFAADLWFWHQSIFYIGPGLATLLANFQVFILLIIGVGFMGERVGWRFASGLGLACLGLWLLFGREWSGLTPEARLGVILGLLTALAYSGYLLSLRGLQVRHPGIRSEARLFQVCVLCALMMLAIGISEGHTFTIPDTRSLAALIALGVICQVAGWLMITRGMPGLAASLVGLALLIQPAGSMLWDALIFGLRLSPAQLAGALLALAGIYLGLRSQARRKPQSGAGN